MQGVDPEDLAFRLARYLGLFGDDSVAKVTPMAPTDPLRTWYDDWQHAAPERDTRRHAPTRLDYVMQRGCSFDVLRTLGGVERDAMPSFGHILMAPSHEARPPQVGDLTLEFQGAAAFRARQGAERDQRRRGGDEHTQRPDVTAREPTVTASSSTHDVSFIDLPSDLSAAASSTVPPLFSPAPASAAAAADPQTDRCGICLELFQPGEQIGFMQCNHEMHLTCFDQYTAHALTF